MFKTHYFSLLLTICSPNRTWQVVWWYYAAQAAANVSAKPLQESKFLKFAIADSKGVTA
jgi:hypothetical protein